MNQSAQQRLVTNNLDVMLDAWPVGHAIEQRRHVPHIADGLQFLVPRQFIDQRDDVDWPRRLREIYHARINAPVRIQRKIFCPQMFRGLVVRKVVEQNRAQDGALGFHVRGQHAEIKFRGRQCHEPARKSD